MIFFIVWAVTATVVAGFFASAYKAVERDLEFSRLQTKYADRRAKHYQGDYEREAYRNRDLARENNRLKVQLKNRQPVPSDIVRAFSDADHKNVSPRLEINAIGKVVCVPESHWSTLDRSIRGVAQGSDT